MNKITWDKSSRIDGERLSQYLHEDGYAVIRGMLSADEVSTLRDIVAKELHKRGSRYSLGRTQPDAAARVPGIEFIFRHPRVIALFHEIFGTGNTVFTRHCDIHKNMVSGWHKDSGESVSGGYFSGDYFNSIDCKVYKLAIYLQDTNTTSCLTIEPGSHRRSSIRNGKSVSLPSQIGDVTIFDVRLSHTGQRPDFVEQSLKAISRLLNFGKRSAEDTPFITLLHSRYMRLLGHDDRLSVFFTYGANNKFTNEFASSNMSRQMRQVAGGQGSDTPNLLILAKHLQEQGVLTFGINTGANEDSE